MQPVSREGFMPPAALQAVADLFAQAAERGGSLHVLRRGDGTHSGMTVMVDDVKVSLRHVQGREVMLEFNVCIRMPDTVVHDWEADEHRKNIMVAPSAPEPETTKARRIRL